MYDNIDDEVKIQNRVGRNIFTQFSNIVFYSYTGKTTGFAKLISSRQVQSK